MTYRESPPSPSLRGLVAAYWGIDGAAGSGAATHRVLPDGCADLICEFSGRSPHMCWVGTMTRAIVVQAGGRQDVFGIRFVAGGLFPLLGAPLSLLTDGSADYDALPARAWRPPLEHWCDDGDFAARCRRADASLEAVLPRLRFDATAKLLQRLHTGRMPVTSASALADAAGMGLRTLQRRFMEQLGVSPRQHLRYLRFEHARRLLSQHDRRQVDIALAAGYSDQAHFVREFRRFAGVTPGCWR